MALGERIRECRIKAGLSQEKLAELTGVTRQAVTKWESGQSAPNTENLFKLAQVLGTTVDFLLTTDTDRPSVAEQVFQMLKTEQARKEDAQRQQRRRNLSAALSVFGGYLLLFFIGKLLFPPTDAHSLIGWLTSTRVSPDGYLFGWLLSSRLFFVCAALSCLAALLGKRRLSFVTLAGFTLGLLLGQCFGSNPAGAFYGHGHYGWAIWGGMFLLSAVMGILLERFPKENLSPGRTSFRLWLCIFLAAAAGIVLFVRLTLFDPS